MRLLLAAATACLAVSGMVRGDVLSPFSLAARLEARIASGDGITLPDAELEIVRHAGTVDLACGEWPEAFRARAGETVCVAVSPFTGCYDFFDESGAVFWTVVPVSPTTDNWVAPFRHAEAGPKPDDDLYAPWRLVDVWKLSHAESAEFVSHAEFAESAEFFDLDFGFVDNGGHLRFVNNSSGVADPATDLSFTAFALDATNLFFAAAWPTNDALPGNVLDLYGSTNLSSRWTFLSSHPATNPPVCFSVAPVSLPWHVAPTSHVHDATCSSVTNFVVSPLDGVTVYTNEFWSCATNLLPGDIGFFRLGTRFDGDGDGLFDAFELLSFGTSTNACDTDGDGLSDGEEFSAGTDPCNPDTDGDGVPDGLSAAEWLAHPLWAADLASADLVVFLYEPVSNGVAALRFDDLCIPLSTNAGPWFLSIPTNTVVTCRLVSGADTTVMLWYGPPEAVVRTRSALAPGWTVPPFVARPLWACHPMDVFGGNVGGGACGFARPFLLLGGPGSWSPGGRCFHSLAETVCTWSVLPSACEASLEPRVDGYVDQDVAERTFWLELDPLEVGPANGRAGTFSLWGDGPFFGDCVLWGELSATLSGHLCVEGFDSFCPACGAHHGSDAPGKCFHQVWCAAKADSGADCDCAGPFVRIGESGSWRLVGSEMCCCTLAGASGWAELVSAPDGLGAAVTNGIRLRVEPTERSPVIGGFRAAYRVYDMTGGVVRTLTMPFTCADLGIDPVPGNAPVPHEWQNDPKAYYVTNGTLHVARRSQPYPIRLWNESPSNARLVFDFDSPDTGPTVSASQSNVAFYELSATNSSPFSALNSDTTVYLDANCSNAIATLSLTLSDPATNRTFLTESLSVKVVDTDIGEHWRVRSATDRLSWDFSDAPEDVYAYLWTPGHESPFGELVEFSVSRTPSFSLDLPPGDYFCEAYFPRVYGGSFEAFWSTNYLHVVHTEVTPSENLRFTNATERACFALTNNNGQVANWTISPVVAGGPMLHASKTGGAGSATHVDNATSVWVQAGSAPGRYTITATHPDCPVSTADATFTVGRVDVESLLFNWDTTGSTRDAINLRWNYKDAINLATGEWTHAGYRAPACYVTNASPLVKATFSVAPTNLPVVRLFAETSAAVGGFAVTNVSFSNGAASNVVLSTRSSATNCVLKETFDLTWKAVVSNETEIVTNTLGKTDGHVFYTILDEPKLPWTDSEIANTNVWVSALEFVMKTNACFGASSKEMALSELTQYLFGELGLHYDLSSGGPSFTDFTAADWRVVGGSRPIFSATRYMNNVSSGSAGITTPASSVNCYDQAAALTTFGTMIGIDVSYRFLLPFGYINLTNLVGWGLCNNPIPGSCRNPNLIVGADDIFPNRSLFGNHAFCSYSGMAFDACAGPALGSLSVADYLEAAIDHSSSTTGSIYSETNSSICGIGKTPNLGFIKKLE